MHGLWELPLAGEGVSGDEALPLETCFLGGLLQEHSSCNRTQRKEVIDPFDRCDSYRKGDNAPPVIQSTTVEQSSLNRSPLHATSGSPETIGSGPANTLSPQWSRGRSQRRSDRAGRRSARLIAIARSGLHAVSHSATSTGPAIRHSRAITSPAFLGLRAGSTNHAPAVAVCTLLLTTTKTRIATIVPVAAA